MEVIRVFAIDDHRIFLEGVVRLIDDHPDLKIVGTAGNGREALKLVAELKPDVVLTDISMPHLNGMEAARLIKKICPDTKVLILTMHENEEFLRRVLGANGSGYLLKDASADELFTAIKEAHRGNTYLSPTLSKRLISEFLERDTKPRSNRAASILSGREREVLQLLAEGHSNQSVASSLNLSLNTVETHRKHIMKKLDMHHLSKLIRYAIQEGIVGA